MHPHISLITLGVQNLERSLQFYRNGLGWKTTSKPEDGVLFFQLSTIILGLFPRAELAKDAGIQDDGGTFGGFSLAHNVMNKWEVDATIETMHKAGGKIIKKPEDTFWGGYSGYVADPDGHLWEIAWNPHWKMDEHGIVHLP